MIQSLIDKLAKAPVSAWQINEIRKKSHQSFLAQSETECRRTVETVKHRVTIYDLRDGVMGFSSFTLGQAALSQFDRSLDMALMAARLTSNQPFNLPSAKDGLPDVKLHDESLSFSTLKSLEERLLSAVSKEHHIRLSSAEFFVDEKHVRLVNSNGLDLEQQESQIQTELILLAKNGTEEKEFIDRYARRLLNQFDLESEVAQSARQAQDATRAVLPRTGGFPVVLAEEPLDRLFTPLLARASARIKYNRMLDVEIGNSIGQEEARGDTITLSSNPLIPGALGSFRFDGYGTPARQVRLIHNNKVEALLADQRHADYLKVPVTGELGNVEVEGGTSEYADLIRPETSGRDTLYLIQAFSAFEPNAITGAFSAEIRSGYEITEGGIQPIKGGSVSGVLQRDIMDCRLSRERVQRERALVPRGILFKTLDIAGR